MSDGKRREYTNVYQVRTIEGHEVNPGYWRDDGTESIPHLREVLPGDIDPDAALAKQSRVAELEAENARLRAEVARLRECLEYFWESLEQVHYDYSLDETEMFKDMRAKARELLAGKDGI